MLGFSDDSLWQNIVYVYVLLLLDMETEMDQLGINRRWYFRLSTYEESLAACRCVLCLEFLFILYHSSVPKLEGCWLEGK